MSKNSEKGRKGEHAAIGIFGKVGVHELGVEVLRASVTTAPEDGVDIEVRCPHNLSIKFDEIASKGSSELAMATSRIDVRIQVKNYSGTINKATAQGFVDDIPKNERFGEHWGIGGTRLTKGAQEVIANASKIAPVKWYTAPEFEKIQNHYPEVPFTKINGIENDGKHKANDC